MINLKIRSEYSFRKVFGHTKDVVDAVVKSQNGNKVCAVTDMSAGTWGHLPFNNYCKDKGIKPLFGTEIKVTPDLEKNRVVGNYMTFIAMNNSGFQNLNKLVWRAHENKYYEPRISFEDLKWVSNKGILVLSGTNFNQEFYPFVDSIHHFYLEINVGDRVWNPKAIQIAKELNREIVVVNDNYYPNAEDRSVYQIITGKVHLKDRSSPMHILNEQELRIHINVDIDDHWFKNTHKIASLIDVNLSNAQNIIYNGAESLENLCDQGLRKRGITRRKLKGEYKVYIDRMKRELDLIEKKNFTDYFLVVNDLVRFAKKTMLVGPARGSSAGSLVCYLIGITEVDPIKHGLIFERFVDINRSDLPDIDIDFPDIKRDKVINYLFEKYGHKNVCRIGTISKYKPKSAIGNSAKEFGIPVWETSELKDSILERSSGDARSSMCIADTFNDLDIGKEFINKYPYMKIVERIEAHASHTGIHAAGIIVCNDDVTNYCGIQGDTAMVDKIDAEKLNLLKIDVLGLRTLSVIEDTLKQIDITYEDLYSLDLEDSNAFNVVNKRHFSGIFQFEGYALQSIVKRMGVRCFSDIVAITSLARPGPLHSGGTSEFIERRIEEKPVSYIHDKIKPYVQETYGVVVFQEQVMNIVKNLGNFSWEDTSTIRKAMSKSYGDEYFSQFYDLFEKGCKSNGIGASIAKTIWENVMTFGSWAFNKSHAVSYGIISYWCMWLKAVYPLEFAMGCLNNAKDSDHSVKLLRELVKEGYKYIPADKDLSGLNWSVVDGKLVGGLQNINGIGPKMAKEIIRKRESGEPFTPSQQIKLDNPVTPYDDIFEAERRWGDIYMNPEKHKIKSQRVSYIRDINQDGQYIIIAKIKEKNLRDLNEYNSVKIRGGKTYSGPTQFLNMFVEDDTDSIIVTIGRFDFARIGKNIAENEKEGTWFIFKGEIKGGRRKLYIKQIRKLGL